MNTRASLASAAGAGAAGIVAARALAGREDAVYHRLTAGTLAPPG